MNGQENNMPASQFDEKPLYLRVEEQIQDLIIQEELNVGDAIPGRNDLCDRFSVSDLTVRKAIGHLVQQGVLVTRQGRGTFVASNPNIKKVLFVCGVDIFGSDVSSFYTHFLQICQREISRHGLTIKPVWLSNERPEESYMYCNSKYLKGYEGVIFIGCSLSHPLCRYVRQERICNVIVTHEEAGPRHVTSSMDYAMAQAIDHLQNSGEHEITVVCNADLIEKVKEIASQEPKISRIVEMQSTVRAAECEAEGYYFMQSQLKTNPHNQNALIFLDDIVARGASRAVLESGCGAQTDWVVFCGLQEIVPLGFPVAYIVLDTEFKAKEAVRIIMQQIEGRSGEPDSYDEKPQLMLPGEVNGIIEASFDINSYIVHECLC